MKDGFISLIAVVLFVVLLTFMFSASVKNQDASDYHEICMDGVLYYNSGYKLAPVFNQDSTVRVCE